MTKKQTTEGQVDIFEAFGLVDEVAEKKKQEEAERAIKEAERAKEMAQRKSELEARLQEAQSKKESKNPPAPFEVNNLTTVYYYGNVFPLSDHFEADELEEGILKKTKEGQERVKLNEEIVRARLAKTYFNLVKDYTEIVYREDKNMLVVLNKAKKKGAPKTYYAVDYLMYNEGLIPFSILQQFIQAARMLAEHGMELHSDIYHEPNNNSFVLDFPKQTVHPYWVEVTEDAISLVTRTEGLVKIAEMHSHHSMRPTPSSQDNESERVPGMIYIIVGEVQNYFPSITCRTFNGERHVKLDPHGIFDSIVGDAPLLSSAVISNINFASTSEG